MAEVEIRNEKELVAWLKGKPRHWSIAIAARAALRVVSAWRPITIGGRDNIADDRFVLALFRCVAVSRLVALAPSQDLSHIATAAARSALSALSAARSALSAPRSALSAADTAISAADSARSAANSASVTRSARSAADSASAARSDIAALFYAWYAISLDANALNAEAPDAITGPLLMQESEEFSRHDWQTFASALSAKNDHWRAWIEWYEPLIDGKVPWGLPAETGHDITFKILNWPESEWEQGPAHINGRIAALVEKARAEQLKLLQEREPPRIPEPKVGPNWTPDANTGLLDPKPRMSVLTVNETSDVASLLPLLRECTEDLLGAARGSNSNSISMFLPRVEKYHAALSRPLDEISIDEIYAAGVRLRNAHERLRREVADEGMPDVAMHIGEAFDSAIGLHGPLVLSTERGRLLDRLAREHNRTRSEELAYKDKAEDFAARVNASSRFVTPEGKALVRDVNSEISEGPFPERSTAVAEATNTNLLVAAAKWSVTQVRNDGVKSVAYTTAGAAVVKLGFDPASLFLLQNQPLLVSLAASSGESLAWLPSFLRWLEARIGYARK